MCLSSDPTGTAIPAAVRLALGLASTLSGPSVNPPKLDLDQLRRQARDVARDGADSRALLPLPMMAKAAQKKDMEKLFDKALKRPDCKEVYSGVCQESCPLF
ncbi:MAG: hypothetical protein ACK511_14315 [Burkholderiales bacterium]|jgi:hypothetical protein|nr:hypothetical protein [Betaproteobacteria bacterium]